MIVNLRVDDRLIHGQVTQGWVPSLHINTIVVVSDVLADNPVRQQVMQLGVPPSVRVLFMTVTQVLDALQDLSSTSERVMLLSDSPGPFCALSRALNQRQEDSPILTLGNLHGADRAHKLGQTVFCSEQEYSQLSELARNGVNLECCAGVHDASEQVQMGVWQESTDSSLS